MNNIWNGLIAGFVATVVLSAIMLMNAAMGLMPELDVIAMPAGMMGTGAAVAWLAHFMIGTIIWGGLFGLMEPALPGHSLWLKGVVVGVGAWAMMMIVVMPMAGAGLLGLRLGISAPIATLMLHAIFGAVLGSTYALLHGPAHRHLHAHT